MGSTPEAFAEMSRDVCDKSSGGQLAKIMLTIPKSANQIHDLEGYAQNPIEYIKH